ncbi:MAG: phosphatase PAP2 family protein [Chitinivibrionales bacterium]|nr:phosphatase PAP2 family protein [Chitinivibrionales bacterium]
MFAKLILFDIQLFITLNSLHSAACDYLFIALTQLGNSWVAAPILVFVVIRFLPKDKRVRIIVVWTGTLALSGMGNSLIKSFVQRNRPPLFFERIVERSDAQAQQIKHHMRKSYGDDYPQIHLPGRVLRRRSFPSGHTNFSFSVAMILVLFFGAGLWYVFLLAALVAYSRIYLGIHYPLDILGGVITGCLFTAAAVIPAKYYLIDNKSSGDSVT